MDSEEEVERFEISDSDYYQMFDPTGNRNRKHQTKNDATYGIWADNGSDSEEEMAGLGARGKGRSSGHSRGGRSSGNDSAGISFVSGGFKTELKKEEKKDFNKDDDPMESWIDKKNIKAPMPRYVKGHKGDETGIGQWEKHTRGIGAKLLAQMGHKPGEGLGKKGQGITTPVDAVKRKGKAAIGYYGSERSERSLKDFPVKDVEEEEDKEFKKQMSQWRKQPVEGKKSKPKYVYKTADEVLSSSGGARRRQTTTDVGPKVKVIDMTGREQRVLSGYHAIGKGHDKPDEGEELVSEDGPKKRAFEMPELMHNLNLLVDMAEDDIVHNHRKLRHDKDRIVNLEHEEDRLKTVVEQEENQLNRLKTVLDIVADCEKRCKPDCSDPLTLDSCVGVFKMLQQEFYAEYKIYDLPSLAIALVFPLMRTFFTGWLPLRDPKFGLVTVLEWQLLLQGEASLMAEDSTSQDMDVYQRLIWDVWLPPVRATILNWNVRECVALISLLETWSPALPHWVLENILDQLVLPRLLQEVESWNPLTDTTPIHCWLHPWLSLMGDKLEPLYAPIRHKIASALSSWHPSDASAKIILEPWHGVFRPGHMAAFLVKNILPKLELEIQGLTINPHQQLLDPWRWVMSWKDMMPIQSMVVMLDKVFFPKWHTVLQAWLGNMPNYQDITKWYLGWKAQFPDTLLGHPLIKEHFNKALETMNRAVSGNFAPGIKENIAYFTHAERRVMDTKAAPSPPPSANQETRRADRGSTKISGSAPTTFKELVEKRAEEEDLLYIPLAGRSQEGHQVYRFGAVNIYFDSSVVFMQDERDRWFPTSLSQLAEAAKKVK